ncbi:hypothetical protein HK405_010896, partial [Cladochytrium tenue]
MITKFDNPNGDITARDVNADRAACNDVNGELCDLNNTTLEGRDQVDPSEPAAPSLAVPAETGTSPAGDESQPPAVDMQAEDVCAHEPEPVKPEETDMEGPEGTKKYRCTHPGCNKEIAGLWNAKNHRRTVHNSGPYEFSCEPCRTWYKRKGDLKRHL